VQFRHSGRAEIKHINARKEGPDEDKSLAVDLKLQVRTGIEVLDGFEPLLRGVLFLDSGAVRNEMMDAVRFKNRLEHYRIDMLGSSFFACRLGKFAVEPLDGYEIRVHFTASFSPSGDEVARIAEYLLDEVELVIEPESGELDLDGEE